MSHICVVYDNYHLYIDQLSCIPLCHPKDNHAYYTNVQNTCIARKQMHFCI